MIQLPAQSGTLTKLIAQGNNQAISIAKTLLTNPVLINPAAGMPHAFESQTSMPFVIPIEAESHKQHMEVNVSESLVIAKDNKVNVTDNVAPGSWTWTISGYIPGVPELEVTNLFTPFVTMMTNFLRKAAQNGYLLVFKDIDSAIYYNVVIKSLDIVTQKDCKNRTPVTMTLKAINTMDDLETMAAEAEKNATTVAGTMLGEAKNVGITTGVKLAVSLADVFRTAF